LVADATDPREVGKPKMGATTVRTAASRLSRGAILIPEPKPAADEHSRCELEPGTPKTRGKALCLVSRLRSPTLRVVYFGVRRFESPKPFPKPEIVDITGRAPKPSGFFR
jgi:hypothetical protein